jgi:hypothetical protein
MELVNMLRFVRPIIADEYMKVEYQKTHIENVGFGQNGGDSD